jgi:DNA-binding transcriptional MerR regulator/methylmalonyl-CoA mutase cobalamin-binding subunit
MPSRSHDSKETSDEPQQIPSGRLRIANVAELTGVPEPTLRAWERRYGVPTPQRTASGYRQYGPNEIAQVREMCRLLANGIAAAEAARMVREGSTTDGAAPEPTVRDPYNVAREAIIDAIQRFDDDALDMQLRALLFLGPTVALIDRVVVPVLRHVGDLWHSGELGVAQEHFASHRMGTLVSDLTRLATGAHGGARVVLASFADDEHELGLLSTAARFATWGFRPVFLGARTPPDAVGSAVEAVEPKLVALSCTVSPARARARELIDGYASACRSVPWIVGGTGIGSMSDLVTARGGILAPEDPVALRSLLRHLTARSTPRPPRPRIRSKR